MDKNNKLLYWGFGAGAFVIALVTYLLTVQPTVPFWDCGEFSAAAIWQQVPHPPGAPLFLIIGKLFHDLIPFGDEGWRINLVSVFSSAIIVWLLYTITVKVIRVFRPSSEESLGDALGVYGSAFLAATAFTFSDTFWFNAVESEVYAMSLLFVAVIIYLLMKWNEKSEEIGSERYLLIIAYLIGLSTGVHLLSILTVFSIVLMISFKKSEDPVKAMLIAVPVSLVIFFVVYPGVVKWIPVMLAGNLPFKNECGEYLVEGSLFIIGFTITVILAFGVGGYIVGRVGKMNWLKFASLSFLLMILGYTTYTQILLRSNANPPMNENEPKNFSKLASYLGREQYGDAPSWPRRYSVDSYHTNYYNQAYIDPKTGDSVYTYGPWYRPETVDAQCKEEGKTVSVPEFTKTNLGGELSYFFKYQVGHMYFRYFSWNFVGRKGDVQDAGAYFLPIGKGTQQEIKRLNHRTGYGDLFPIKFFALPLVFGIVGLVFHFYRDPKTALVFLVMFLMMGVLTAIAQNQQQPQPRERDYFYAGSFMIFAMWIGMAALGAIDLIRSLMAQSGEEENREKTGLPAFIPAAILAVSLLIVPINMAAGGWKMHSRAGNYLPFDYSYNILQSVDENAIIFTNGDNDTFPLWYLQDVAGVRRDVRVVNLSLGNTLWYVDQLKNREPWGAEKIPLSFSDISLTVEETDDRALKYDFSPAKTVEIDVDPEILKKYGAGDAQMRTGKMQFTFVGKPYTVMDEEQWYLIRVQDKLVLDILRQTNFSRPVYFSTTVGPDAFCGLEPFFRHEGMAMRICPVRQNLNGDEVDAEVMDACLMNVDNSNDYSKTPKLGFKFRNLDNSGVYYDEVHRRLMTNYRSLYMSYASSVVDDGNDEKASAIIDKMNATISPEQFPMTFDMLFKVARLYDKAGDTTDANLYADLTIDACMELIDNPYIERRIIESELMGEVWGPYRIASMMYQLKGDYKGAISIIQRTMNDAQQFASRMSSALSTEKQYRIRYLMIDLQLSMDELEVDQLIEEGKKTEALEKATAYMQDYNSRQFGYEFTKNMQRKIDRLQAEIGFVSEDTAQ